MLWKLFDSYPATFILTVIFPLVAGLGAFVGSWGGYENLRRQFASSQQSQRIEQGVSSLLSNDSVLQSTLRLLESYNEKITAAGKRDAVLAAIINQYQQLSRAATLFGQISHRDPSQDQGIVATKY